MSGPTDLVAEMHDRLAAVLAHPPVPDSVRIGTVPYHVTQHADDWQRIEHTTRTSGYYGHTVHREATIYLNPEASPQVTRLTLWHEVLHALAEVTMGNPDWRALGGDREDRDATEETVVRMWEHPTLAVLRDNPALVKYLTDAD